MAAVDFFDADNFSLMDVIKLGAQLKARLGPELFTKLTTGEPKEVFEVLSSNGQYFDPNTLFLLCNKMTTVVNQNHKFVLTPKQPAKPFALATVKIVFSRFNPFATNSRRLPNTTAEVTHSEVESTERKILRINLDMAFSKFQLLTNYRQEGSALNISVC